MSNFSELITHSPSLTPSLLQFQRGDGGVQEHLLHCVGRGGTGQDPPLVAALLSEHPRVDLCGGLE